MPSWELEHAAASQGYAAVCGCDEAGAGPLAGRVYARAAAARSVAWVEPGEIDEIDILNSRIKAMQLAIDGLEPTADFALIDGNRDHGSRCAIAVPHKLVVKGDSLSMSIAAASILAKVSRDRIWGRWRFCIPNMSLNVTKDILPSATTSCCGNSGPVPFTAGAF